MMAGKVAVVAGFGDVGRARRKACGHAGCRVMVTEADRFARCRRRWKAAKSPPWKTR